MQDLQHHHSHSGRSGVAVLAALALAQVGLLGMLGYQKHQVMQDYERQKPAISLYLDRLPMGPSVVEFSKGSTDFRTTLTKSSESPDIVKFSVASKKSGYDWGNTSTSSLDFTLVRQETDGNVIVQKDPKSCTCATYHYIVKHPYQDLSVLEIPKGFK